MLGLVAYGQTPSDAPPDMVTYYIGFLKRNPNAPTLGNEESKKVMDGHMAHMRKSHAAGALIVAGPIADKGDLRGILVYKTATLEEAERWANQDPAVIAGRFVLEIHPWLVQKGVLPDAKLIPDAK